MKKSDKVFFQTVIVLAVFLWLLVSIISMDYNWLVASVIVYMGSLSGACLVTNFYELIEREDEK